MADFTLNAPGSTNNPWVPASVLVLLSTIKSDANGFRAQTAGVLVAFAHNVNYGSSVEATLTVSANAGSNGDTAICGPLVRSGANAGAIVGMFNGAFSIQLVSADNLGNVTTISGSLGITRSNTDVFDCIASNSGSTISLVGKYNGTIQSFVGTTTTAFATEASLAAGGQIAPNNNNSLYFSQFTGTGVSGGGGTVFTPFSQTQFFVTDRVVQF